MVFYVRAWTITVAGKLPLRDGMWRPFLRTWERRGDPKSSKTRQRNSWNPPTSRNPATRPCSSHRKSLLPNTPAASSIWFPSWRRIKTLGRILRLKPKDLSQALKNCWKAVVDNGECIDQGRIVLNTKAFFLNLLVVVVIKLIKPLQLVTRLILYPLLIELRLNHTQLSFTRPRLT